VAAYADAEQIANTIMTVTNMLLPPEILVGKRCIPDGNVPIRTGVTCDVYSASFLGGKKVAKKVFRIGTSEKADVKKYAEVSC
jgi:serine/threonine-protein kinase RIO1